MYVDRVVLQGFKRFHLGRIFRLDARFPYPVTIITGTNSGGKSSALVKFCPLPGVRTEFTHRGVHELYITHNNDSYRLRSDYGHNRTSPHSFYCNGINLNVSGNTAIQEELIAEHFGITPAIHKLIYSKLRICQAKQAERKTFFLNMNPAKLGFILDAHKKCLQKLKDTQANIKLLISRKTELESRLIAPEVLASHVQTKANLTATLQDLEKMSYILEQHIANLRDQYNVQEGDTLDIDHEDLRYRCHQLIARSVLYLGIDDESSTDKYSNLREYRSTIQERIASTTTYIQSIQQEIEHIDSTLQSTTSSRDVASIDKDIQDIQQQLDKYTVTPSTDVQLIDKSCIDRAYTLLDQLIDELRYFSDTSDYIYTDRTIDRICNHLDHHQDVVDSTRIQLSSSLSKQGELQRERNEFCIRTSVPSTCNLTCGLRSNYTSHLEYLDKQLATSKELTAKYTSQYSKAKCIQDKLTSKFGVYKYNSMRNHYTRLTSILLQFTTICNLDYLHGNLVRILRTDPMSIAKYIEDLILRSKTEHERQHLLGILTTLQQERVTADKYSEQSKTILNNLRSSKQEHLDKCIHELSTYEQELVTIDKELTRYTNYLRDKDEYTKLEQEYTSKETKYIVSKSIEYWVDVLAKLTKCKEDIQEQLRRIETIVKDQELIRHSYHTEIVSTLGKVEHEKLIYEQMEQALSPSTGIPYRSMVKYLNTLIEHVNYFLSQIWTQHLQIQYISDSTPLDYSFKVETSDEVSTDMSTLSDGQTEILNFIWILTILLQLKLLDNIPLYGDELGRALDTTHRTRLLSFLSGLIDSKIINQLFLINHYALFTEGFKERNVLCLHPDNVGELPSDVNASMDITYY